MVLHQRQAVKTGGSYRITLPPAWARTEGIDGETNLDVLEAGLLVILPPREMSEEELNESFECIKRMLKIAYRNRNSRK